MKTHVNEIMMNSLKRYFLMFFLRIGILKLTVSDAKLALSKEIVANKVLPYLFPLSIENGLSVVQYSAVMTLIRELIDRVETEHKAKLEQLSSIQNEQR